MQIFNINALRRYTDVDAFEINLGDVDICTGDIGVQTIKNTSVVYSQLDANTMFNLTKEKNIKLETATYATNINIFEQNESDVILVLDGLVMLLPIYNAAYGRYLGVNFSSTNGIYSGILNLNENILEYVINRDDLDMQSGVFYNYDFSTDQTTITYNRSVTYLEQIESIILDVTLKTSVKNIENTYIYRGDIVDANAPYFDLTNVNNTSALWEQ